MPERTTRQTLLFSATLSHRVLELAYEHMNEPEKLVVETEHITAARVRQKLYYPADEEKLPLLLGLLSRSEGARTLVFVNTKAFVERVARALEKAGYRVGVLSGDVPQKKRESLLKKFQAGQLELLVATDVAARGLHIDGVSHVYNYDLPFDAEDYVHRIGRTARLGAEGDAISFACERYGMSLPDIEAYIDQKIPGEHVTPEMLVALPRKPRAQQVEVDAEEGESIGEIFKEVREARAAEDAKRGGSRSGPGAGRPGERGPRSAAGARSSGSGESRGPRPPRKPKLDVSVEGDAVARSPAVAAAVIAAPVSGPTIPAADGEKPARKRRRRRGGKPLENAAAATESTSAGNSTSQVAATKPAARPAKAAATSAANQAAAAPSLFSRIGKGLKSLVTRAPRNQH
ncbi:MAG: ATP-dependent RNA helicase RhlB, partial [Thermomonas sp.]